MYQIDYHVLTCHHLKSTGRRSFLLADDEDTGATSPDTEVVMLPDVDE